MLELITRLESDLAVASRGHLPELSTLRFLKSALQNEIIALRATKKELDEAGAWGVLRRELKKRREAAEIYKQGGRLELAATEETEAGIIERYLPPAPKVDDIKIIATELKAQLNVTGPSAIGQLTKAVLAHYNGTADGKIVSEVVRSLVG